MVFNVPEESGLGIFVTCGDLLPFGLAFRVGSYNVIALIFYLFIGKRSSSSSSSMSIVFLSVSTRTSTHYRNKINWSFIPSLTTLTYCFVLFTYVYTILLPKAGSFGLSKFIYKCRSYVLTPVFASVQKNW